MAANHYNRINEFEVNLFQKQCHSTTRFLTSAIHIKRSLKEESDEKT